MLKSELERLVEHYLEEAYNHVFGRNSRPRDMAQAEVNFREAAKLDRTGRSYYFLGRFFADRNMSAECSEAMKAAGDAGFAPGFIWQIQDKCNGSWFGELSEEELSRLAKAADEGYVRAKIFYLSNLKYKSSRRALKTGLQVRRAKKHLKKAQASHEYKRNELYW